MNFDDPSKSSTHQPRAWQTRETVPSRTTIESGLALPSSESGVACASPTVAPDVHDGAAGPEQDARATAARGAARRTPDI